MKKVRIALLTGITLWTAMTLMDDISTMTPASYGAQSTYEFTVIQEFAPSSMLEPSFFSVVPAITNDGTVVYSVGTVLNSSIFSSDGTVTRLLVGPFNHQFTPLSISVSGNGMMVTNVLREIVDVHEGTVVGSLDPGDGFLAATGPNPFYDVSINNRGSIAFTGAIGRELWFPPTGTG